MTTYTKATPGVLDYSIDYTSWLDGDTITVSTWSADTGITIDSDSNTTAVTTVRVSGGDAAKSYRLVNSITTAAGLEDRRCITINVKDCR
jgi:hypothetical protein